MKINLYTDKCIGCGMCAAVAPDLFSIDSGIVTLKKDPATYVENDENFAREAAAACPNDVIEISKE